MKQSIKFLIPVLLFFASCDRTKKIDPKIFEEDPKLVINSFIFTGDDITVSVSKSAGITDYDENKVIVKNAVVKLFADGQFIQTIPYDASMEEYTSTVEAVAGKTYSLNVSAPGLKEVTSETIATVPVPITGLERKKNVSVDADGDAMDELHIRFTDPPAPGDLYIIRFVSDQENDINGYRVISFDASVESIIPGIEEPSTSGIINTPEAVYIRDQLFNGQQKELILTCRNKLLEPVQTTDSSGAPITTYTTIHLIHVTSDYYQFYKSYQLQDYYETEQPMNVYTNVVNGYGCFSIMGHDEIEIH